MLEYELIRHDDGTVHQHERYEDEAGRWKHLEVTADGQVAWGESTESLSLTVIGALSDRYWEQFDGWDGPDVTLASSLNDPVGARAPGSTGDWRMTSRPAGQPMSARPSASSL